MCARLSDTLVHRTSVSSRIEGHLVVRLFKVDAMVVWILTDVHCIQFELYQVVYVVDEIVS